MITKEVKEYIDSLLSKIERQYALDYAGYRDGDSSGPPPKPRSMSDATAKAIAKKIDKLWPQGVHFDETSHYRASMISYRGALYRQSEKKKRRTIEKGVFNDVDKAWEWARLKIQQDEGWLVVVDAVGGRTPTEIPLYASPSDDGKAMERIVSLHMKGGKHRSYKDLLVVKSRKDLEG